MPPDDDGDGADEGDAARDPVPVGWAPPGELGPAPVGDAEADPVPVAVAELAPDVAVLLPALAGAPAPLPATDEPDERLEDTNRAREPPWPPVPELPAAPVPAPPRPVRDPTACPGAPGAAGTAPAGPAAPAAGEEPGGEPPGTCTIRTDTDASTNTAISAPAASTGSTLPAGCSRITAAARRSPCPALLAPSASVSFGRGSAGP
jgi:hypothetical protein